MTRFSKYTLFAGFVMMLCSAVITGGGLLGAYELGRVECENVFGLTAMGLILLCLGVGSLIGESNRTEQ